MAPRYDNPVVNYSFSNLMQNFSTPNLNTNRPAHVQSFNNLDIQNIQPKPKRYSILLRPIHKDNHANDSPADHQMIHTPSWAETKLMHYFEKQSAIIGELAERIKLQEEHDKHTNRRISDRLDADYNGLKIAQLSSRSRYEEEKLDKNDLSESESESSSSSSIEPNEARSPIKSILLKPRPDGFRTRRRTGSVVKILSPREAEQTQKKRNSLLIKINKPLEKDYFSKYPTEKASSKAIKIKKKPRSDDIEADLEQSNILEDREERVRVKPQKLLRERRLRTECSEIDDSETAEPQL